MMPEKELIRRAQQRVNLNLENAEHLPQIAGFYQKQGRSVHGNDPEMWFLFQIPDAKCSQYLFRYKRHPDDGRVG